MQYLIVLLEGIITFISPCILPMIPIYVSYFAGSGEENTAKTALNAVFFVLGFTAVFVAMGIFAGTIGMVLRKYHGILNIAVGAVMILLGLNYLGVIKLNIFKGGQGSRDTSKQLNVLRSLLFGMVFAVGWTPCVGTFLGSALLLAGNSATALKGGLMLLLYSVGLGIPFILSAVLIDQLKAAFKWIKAHYKVITAVSGALLVAVGIMMCLGLFDRLFAVVL